MADKSSASQDYITFLSRGPEKGLSLDVTDLMITTEPAAANILDVRKTVWLKLILVFIHRHDLRVLSKKKKFNLQNHTILWPGYPVPQFNTTKLKYFASGLFSNLGK